MVSIVYFIDMTRLAHPPLSPLVRLMRFYCYHLNDWIYLVVQKCLINLLFDHCLTKMFGRMIVLLWSQRRVNRRRKAPNMLHGHLVILPRLQKLVQNCKNLRVQHFKPPNPIHHSLQTLRHRNISARN